MSNPGAENRERRRDRRTRRRRNPHILVAGRLGLVLLAGLAIAGCGKKNLPQPPPGTPVTYPRVYPSV